MIEHSAVVTNQSNDTNKAGNILISYLLTYQLPNGPMIQSVDLEVRMRGHDRLGYQR